MICVFLQRQLCKNDQQGQIDVLINDNCKVVGVELKFDKRTDIQIAEIKTILNEFSLYSRVNVNSFLTGLSDTSFTSISEMQIPVRTGFVNDKSGSVPIIIFIDIYSVGKKVRVLSKYKADDLLKTLK